MTPSPEGRSAKREGWCRFTAHQALQAFVGLTVVFALATWEWESEKVATHIGHQGHMDGLADDVAHHQVSASLSQIIK